MRSSPARPSRAEGTLNITIMNAMSGREIVKCTVLPTDLIVHLKQYVKAVQDVPEIRLINQKGELLNTVQTVEDCGLQNNDTVLAVLMAHRLVATASSDGKVRTWDTDNNSVEREVRVAPARSLLAACFSPDGHHLVTGSAVGTPKLWDAKTGDLRKVFEEHRGSVSCVDISSNARFVVSGGYDYSARVWDIETGSCIRALVDDELELTAGMLPRSHELQLLSVKFSPFDSNVVATTSADCTAKLWNVQTGRCMLKLWHEGGEHGPHPVTSVCFAANGQDIVTTSDHYATMWNVHTGHEIRTWEAHTSQVTSSAFSVEDSLLLTGSKDGTAKLWDLSSGLCRRTLQGHDGPVSTVALAPDNKLAVTGSCDGQAKVWNTQTGMCEQTLEGNHLGVVMATFVPC